MRGKQRPGKKVEEIIRSRVSRARKEEVMETYEDLINTIWNRIYPTLGKITVVSIMERAIKITNKQFPMVSQIEVTNEGLVFDVLKKHLEDEKKKEIRNALKELIVNIIDILAMLTGDVLVSQLMTEMDRNAEDE